ncbi:hypothetical protein B0H14DRAFT_2554180 [Mycena olivaceomarginata]|nr:hypothetical protein B0H14DRAFT_2554180 [Mycena olivaceomarginata]
MVKRKRDDASPKGLAAGEPLKRTAHAVAASSWGWVGSEATDTADITVEHLSATCGFSKRNTHPFCRNKYAKLPPKKERKKPPPPINGEIEEDIIVISSDDDEDINCTKKLCRNNPNCLNYLGQKKWEDEGKPLRCHAGRSNCLAQRKPGRCNNPAEDARDENLPVGLKVWFRDMAFRSGVYNCQSTEGSADKFKALFPHIHIFLKLTLTPPGFAYFPTSEQSNPALQSLITDQFQGKQVYGTICHKCRSVSARDTDFLEIEINFKNNANLEDSIAELLQQETLSGDNHLQDATRYTELASLPPVLHFSLLRFVYDLSTMERRKSKHAMNFPKTLDMTPFLGKAADRGSASSAKSEGNIYELRGVLLHKGKSAYHGHYEAQVFDATNLVSTDDKSSRKQDVIDVEEERREYVNARNKQRQNARKRRRVEDSDDESNSPPAGHSRNSVPRPTAHDPQRFCMIECINQARISSKDGLHASFMLEKKHAPSLQGYQTPPIPPPGALAVVEALNTAHKEACESYEEKEKNATARFLETRRKVLDIYQSWTVNPDEKNYAIVSEKALESWIERMRSWQPSNRTNSFGSAKNINQGYLVFRA